MHRGGGGPGYAPSVLPPSRPSRTLPVRAVALVATGALLGLAGPAGAAEEPKPGSRTIPVGVTTQGVALGGMNERDAAKLVRRELGPKVERTTVLRAGGRTFRMSHRAVDLRLDATLTAARAARATPRTAVPPGVSVSTAKVRAWVAANPGRAGRAARSSRLRVGIKRMDVSRSRRGWRIDQAPTVRVILRAVTDPSASRKLVKRVTVTRPAATAADVRRRNGTIVTIDRRSFRLRLFKRLKLVKSYGIAVGKAGNGTPAGMYRVQNKQFNPTWVVPNSDWAGSLAGQTIPAGDPRNPIRGRWIGVNGSIGIHGTNDAGSIGSRASHGCIRMHVSSVKRLYARVPVGTPVKIA